MYWNDGAFCGYSVGKPHGIVEFWETGIEKQKKVYSKYVLGILFSLNPSFQDSNIPLLQFYQ